MGRGRGPPVAAGSLRCSTHRNGYVCFATGPYLRAVDKHQERRFVELARRAGAALPPGDLIDSESPDFLIASAEDRPAGVEVTRFSRQRARAEIIREEARRNGGRRTRRIEARARPPVKPEEVAAIIRRKEARLASYRGKAEPVWLLIVFGAFRARSRARVTDRVIAHPFVTSFAGVVLYDALDLQAWTIRSTAPLGAVPEVQPYERLGGNLDPGGIALGLRDGDALLAHRLQVKVQGLAHEPLGFLARIPGCRDARQIG